MSLRGNETLPALAGLYTTWSSFGLLTKLLISFLAFLLFIFLLLALIISNAPSSPPQTKETHALPGPPRRWYSFLLGNTPDIVDYRDSLIPPSWAAGGATGRYLSLFGLDRVFTFDPAATRHIFAHVDEFERPADARRILGRVMGDNSLLAVHGAPHRRQRRIMDPAFSTAAIRDMIPAMFEKAAELHTLLARLVADDTLERYACPIPPKDIDRVPGARKVDMLSLMGRMTADVIGKVFFGHDFESLSTPEGSTIVKAFDTMTNAAHEVAFLTEAQNGVPILDKFPSKNRREIDACRELMGKISDDLVEKRKRVRGEDDKDLLALLINANEAEREDHRMANDEIRAQMATLLFAGSTTTGATISSALHHLALNPDIQRRLRAEIEAVGEESPSSDVLNALPLLDKVVRETLRYTPPATCTAREAKKDTIVPLSWPVRGRDGSLIEALPVKKGTYFLISMMMLNRQQEIWGPDADTFNPDRFDDTDVPKVPVPGVWGNVSSFILGPYVCIGYRLAIAEIKVVLYTLLRHFQFDELPSKPHVEYQSSLATRPQVRGEPGGQLPLLVRPLAKD